MDFNVTKHYSTFAPKSDFLKDKLPPALYQIIFTDDGIFFENQAIVPEPEFVFGDVNQKAEDLINRFIELNSKLGVWFNGEKGSGKTLQAQACIRSAVNHGLPVIQVTNAVSGNELYSVLSKLDQPFVLFIDEFEKIYGTSLSSGNNKAEINSEESQKSLLSLLDGLMPSPMMTIITTNNADKVSSFIKGRPGRVRYRWEYSFLSPKVVVEVCKTLYPQASEKLLSSINAINQWSMDSLKVFIEEVKLRPGESILDILETLNIERVSQMFKWTLIKDDKLVGQLYSYFGSPLLESTSYIFNVNLQPRLYLLENTDLLVTKKEERNFSVKIDNLFKNIEPTIKSDPIIITFDTPKGKFEFVSEINNGVLKKDFASLVC